MGTVETHWRPGGFASKRGAVARGLGWTGPTLCFFSVDAEGYGCREARVSYTSPPQRAVAERASRVLALLSADAGTMLVVIALAALGIARCLLVPSSCWFDQCTRRDRGSTIKGSRSRRTFGQQRSDRLAYAIFLNPSKYSANDEINDRIDESFIDLLSRKPAMVEKGPDESGDEIARRLARGDLTPGFRSDNDFFEGSHERPV